MITSVRVHAMDGSLAEVRVEEEGGKEYAILIRDGAVERVQDAEDFKKMTLGKKKEQEILRKASLKLEIGGTSKKFSYFYTDWYRDILKREEVPLYFEKRFIRVPRGANYSLYEWDVFRIDESGDISKITFVFHHYSVANKLGKLQYDDDLMERLREEGFTIKKEL